MTLDNTVIINLQDEINVDMMPDDIQKDILWIHKHYSYHGIRQILFNTITKEASYIWKEGARELNDPRLVKYWTTWRMMLLKNESNIGKGAVFSEETCDVYKNFDEAGRAMWKRRSQGENVLATRIGYEPRLNLEDILYYD